VQVEKQGKPILAITNAIQFIDPLAIVIKIFSVYTHAQIDKRLWDSTGRRLARNIATGARFETAHPTREIMLSCLPAFRRQRNQQMLFLSYQNCRKKIWKR
jgi:hypothetical protein